MFSDFDMNQENFLETQEDNLSTNIDEPALAAELPLLRIDKEKHLDKVERRNSIIAQIEPISTIVTNDKISDQ